MKTLDKLHKIVIQRYNELEAYASLFNKRASKLREELIEKNKDKFLSNPTSVDIKEIAKEMFYINGFHQADIRILQTSFLDSYIMYSQLEGEEKFEEDVTKTAEILKNSLPKQRYIATKDTFDEIVSGSTEKMLKDYEDKNYFKIFESQIDRLFDE